MTQSIPFTFEHDQLLRDGLVRLGSLEAKSGNLEAAIDTLGVRVEALEVKVDALEVKVDALEVKVDALGVRLDTLEVTVKEGFRRADVMHEDLCSKFNIVIDLVLHINQKLDAQSGVQDQVKNHEIRIDLIELHLKKDA